MFSVSIKLIVAIQWMLVVWATYWGPGPYTYGNITALAIGIWAIADKQSVDSIFMFLVTLFLTVIVDIVMLAVHFDTTYCGSSARCGLLKFSAGMAILNLILKPFALLLLYQMYKDRGGEYNVNFGGSPTYDNIGEENQDHGSSAYMNAPVVSKTPA